MRRYEISDEQWERIADLLPNNENKRGAPWKDHRRMLNGMFWIFVVELHGVTCQHAMVIGKRYMTDSGVIG